MSENKIEILAPAGSFDSLKAAVNAGAHAVYIGGKKFGARAHAENLEEDAMLNAIDFVHLHGRKIYLTVNTLFKNKEIEEELYSYLEKYYMAGLDAVIVQDPGVMQFVHNNFPILPIHASTQMTLTMAGGANQLADMGVTRIVTSRELSLSEIKELKENTSFEIESFVHGALCYCYSGQCLMSSIIGGRSGNRGRCAQPCRMPYDLSVDGNITGKKQGEYLLSPKDICTLAIIPELVEAGIHSFKIEGRMKSQEYTALAVSKYKKYTDLYQDLGKEAYQHYIEKHKKELDKDIVELMDLYNRGGFTEGYFKKYNGLDMMSTERPNHNGVLVGMVSGVKGIRAEIRLARDIYSQDILEIRDGKNKVYEFTIKEGVTKESIIYSNFLAKSGVEEGMTVYRTRNSTLLEKINTSYINIPVKTKIQGVFTAKANLPIKLQLECKGVHVEVAGPLAQAALKSPTDMEQTRSLLKQTNTTQFIFDKLVIEQGENLFLPTSQLKALRRNGIEELEKAILSVFRRERPVLTEEEPSYKTSEIAETRLGMVVHLTDTRLLDTILQSKEVDAVYLDMMELDKEELEAAILKVKGAGVKFFLVLPHIYRKNVMETDLFTDKLIDGIVVKNLEELNLLQNELKLPENEIILDYNVYTANKESKMFYNEKSIYHFTASLELNVKELEETGCHDSDLIVYGHIPLMVSAQCVYKTTGQCRKGQKANWNSYLVDRYQKKFYVKNYCRNCYNVIYNGQPISLLKYEKEIGKLGPANIRLDFTLEGKDETARILEAFGQAFKKGGTPSYEIKEYTKGHFKRGVE